MFNHTELQDDLLVEEGHYLEKIQAEALEEAYLYHAIRDFEALLQSYGPKHVLSLLSEKTQQKIKRYLTGERC